MNINRENYEEYLFDYLEGNLSAEQAAEVKQQIDTDPFLQAELKAFEQTILIPSEDIIFPNKEALLKEEKRRIIPLYYYLSAGVAAAIAILAIVYLPKSNVTTPAQLANKPDTAVNMVPDNDDITEEGFVKEEIQLAENNHAGDKKVKDTVVGDKTVTGEKGTNNNSTNKKLDPINADILEYELRKNELEVTNRIAFVLPMTVENTANNGEDTTTNSDEDDYTINRFRLKQEIFDGVSSIFANIKKPKLTLFTKDDNGKKKFRMVFQYDTYSAIIRVR